MIGVLQRPLTFFRHLAGPRPDARGTSGDEVGNLPVSGLRAGPSSMYYDYHPGAKGKPTYVLIHGVAVDAGEWNGEARQLAADGYGVLRVDLLGHGRSGNPKEVYLEDQIKSIDAVIRKLGIKDVNLVGHSYGGAVAVALAAVPSPPAHVAGLHLIAPYVARLDEHAVAQAYDTADAWMRMNPFFLMSEMSAEMMMPGSVEAWRKNVVQNTTDAAAPFSLSVARAELGTFIRERNPNATGAEIALKTDEAISATRNIFDFDTAREAARVPKNIPVQVIAGERDDLVPEDQLDHLVAAFQRSGHQAEKIVLPGTHLVVEENPQQVTQTIEAS